MAPSRCHRTGSSGESTNQIERGAILIPVYGASDSRQRRVSPVSDGVPHDRHRQAGPGAHRRSGRGGGGDRGPGQTCQDPVVVVAAALISPGTPELLARGAELAQTTRDRQLVAIAAAHLDGDRDRVDTLARDHLADHPDSLLVAWIAAGAPQTDASVTSDAEPRKEHEIMNRKLTAVLLSRRRRPHQRRVHRARHGVQLPGHPQGAGRGDPGRVPRPGNQPSRLVHT